MKQFIREPECLKITGLSRPTRWRLEKAKKFPKRYQISANIVGWLSSDIEGWMQSKIDAFQSPAIQCNKLRRNQHDDE